MNKPILLLVLALTACGARSGLESETCEHGKPITGDPYSYANPVANSICDAMGLIGDNQVVWCCEPVATVVDCHEFGEAPEVTTIRAPVTQSSPHPDCVKLDDLSPLGQSVYCCMGDAFQKWYQGI